MLKKKPEIEVLRTLLCERDGVLYWKQKSDPRSPVKVGDRAGNINDRGYVVLRIKGVDMKGHVVVWALHYGEYPTSMIDHKNRCRNDNRIENLRLANNSLNSVNKETRVGVSTYRGVSFVKLSGRWQAYIKKDGVKRTLGTFDTERDAAEAYNSAAVEAFGEFAVLN